MGCLSIHKHRIINKDHACQSQKKVEAWSFIFKSPLFAFKSQNETIDSQNLFFHQNKMFYNRVFENKIIFIA